MHNFISSKRDCHESNDKKTTSNLINEWQFTRCYFSVSALVDSHFVAMYSSQHFHLLCHLRQLKLQTRRVRTRKERQNMLNLFLFNQKSFDIFVLLCKNFITNINCINVKMAINYEMIKCQTENFNYIANTITTRAKKTLFDNKQLYET